MRRGAAVGLLTAGALLLGRPTPAEAQLDTIEIVAELRVRQAFSEVLPMLATGSGQRVLLPFRRLLEMLEIRITDSTSDGTTRGYVEPRGPRFAVRPALRIVERNDSTRTVPAGAVVWRGDDVFVDVDAIAWMLEVQALMDWNELTLLIAATEHLPLVRRRARDRLRDALLRPEEARGVPQLPAYSPPFSGMVLDWSVTSGTRDPADNLGLQFGLGTTVAGGGIEVTHAAQRSSVGWAHQTQGNWIRAWNDQRWIRQLALGDVPGFGPWGRGVRGVYVTNAPFLRLTSFADIDISGRLPAQWEVELRRGDELVAYTPVSETGRYHLPVGLTYGQNPVTLVAYGPAGQVVERTVNVDVPFTRLPPGDVEYGLSAGACVRDIACRWAGSADGRWGISTRWTVRSGVSGFERDTLTDLVHPYIGVAGALRRGLTVEAEGVLDALARGTVRFAPTPDFQAALTHTRYGGGVTQPVIGSLDAHRTDATLVARPPFIGGRTFVQVNVTHNAGALVTADLWRIGLLTRVPGGRLTGAIRGERFSGSGSTSARTLIEAGAEGMLRTAWAWTRMMIVRFGAVWDASDGRLEQAVVGAGRSLPVLDMRADFQAGWSRDRGGIVELVLSTATPAFRAISHNSYDGAAGLQGTQQFEGSALFDPYSGQFFAANGRSLGRAGVNGVVFEDQNGDGLRQPDEPGLADVVLRIGADAVVSDSLGRFAVWDVTPYAGTPIEVDTISLPNPLLVPGTVTAELDAVPNSFRTVFIPFVLGGELTGTVTRPGAQPPAGLRIRLRHLETGEERDVRTFSDGAFYAMGLRPGVWEAVVDEATLERIGWAAPTSRVTVEPGGAAMLDIELRRR